MSRIIINEDVMPALNLLDPTEAIRLLNALVAASKGVQVRDELLSPTVQILFAELRESVTAEDDERASLLAKRREAGRLGGLATAARKSNASSLPEQLSPVQPPETDVTSKVELGTADPNSQQELARARKAPSLWGDYRGVIGVQGEEGGHGGSFSQKATQPKQKCCFLQVLSGLLKSEIPDSLTQAVTDFMTMRTRIHKPMTDRAQVMAARKLYDLSGGDTGVAVQILDQSVFNCWQGLFPLKGDGDYYSRGRVTTMQASAQPGKPFIPQAIEL